MSSTRSRSGGTVITSNARRSSRSLRNWPSAASALQVGIRRADDAHVDAKRLAATDALDLPVLDDAQDLLLHAQRDRREFIEDQRAAVGALEMADMGLAAPVNAPASWPNSSDSRIDSVSAGAVDLDDAAAPSARTGNAGARRSVPCRCRARRRRAPACRQRRGARDVLEHLEKRRRLADDGLDFGRCVRHWQLHQKLVKKTR